MPEYLAHLSTKTPNLCACLREMSVYSAFTEYKMNARCRVSEMAVNNEHKYFHLFAFPTGEISILYDGRGKKTYLNEVHKPCSILPLK